MEERPIAQKIITPSAAQRSAWCVSFSNNNKLVAGGAFDKKVVVVDLDTRNTKTLGGFSPNECVYRSLFSRDGKYVVSSGSTETRVWEVATGRCVERIPHSDAGYAIAFSPNGKTLAIAVRHGDVELYDFVDNDNRLELRKNQSVTLRATPFFVQSMVFSQDASRLITASPNGLVRFWRVADGKEMASFNTNETIREIAFRPDYSELVTASQQGWVRVWPIKRK